MNAQGEVSIDLPCFHCHYNLRTQTTEARCPECGQPVADSLRGDYLWLADPRWLQRLPRAATVLSASLGILALGPLALCTLSSWPTVIGIVAIPICLAVLGCEAAAFVLSGIPRDWRGATPETNDRRVLLRAVMLLAAAAVTLPFGAISGLFKGLTFVGLAAGLFHAVVFLPTLFAYLSSFVSSTGEVRIARRCHCVYVTFILLIPATIAVGLVAAAHGWPPFIGYVLSRVWCATVAIVFAVAAVVSAGIGRALRRAHLQALSLE